MECIGEQLIAAESIEEVMNRLNAGIDVLLEADTHC